MKIRIEGPHGRGKMSVVNAITNALFVKELSNPSEEPVLIDDGETCTSVQHLVTGKNDEKTGDVTVYIHRIQIDRLGENRYRVTQTDMHGVVRFTAECDHQTVKRVIPLLLELEVRP